MPEGNTTPLGKLKERASITLIVNKPDLDIGGPESDAVATGVGAATGVGGGGAGAEERPVTSFSSNEEEKKERGS